MTGDFSDTQRRDVLLDFGAEPSAADEIMERTAGERWWPGRIVDDPKFPLDDELYLEAWRTYHLEALTAGAWPVLKTKLVQLTFPIRPGISKEAAYREVTLKGTPPSEEGVGLHLDDPDSLSLVLHSTLAGTVPILAVHARSDFETLVRALTARNEEIAVPQAMGACLVNGLNNWDRIKILRSHWEAGDPANKTEEAWTQEFRRIIPRPELYKDRFIILSHGPYSNVSAEDVGLEQELWNQLSFDVRMEHECTHALSLRVFGALRHDLLEELIADWIALIKVFGEYRTDLALRFLGLEDFPRFRIGGRLEIYRGDPPLSDDAFFLMQSLAKRSIAHLNDISTQRPDLLTTNEMLGRLTLALSTMPTEAVAAPDGVERILARFEAANLTAYEAQCTSNFRFWAAQSRR